MKTYNIADKLAQDEILHVASELLKSDDQHERYMLTRLSSTDDSKPMNDSVFDSFSRQRDKFLISYKYPKVLEYLLQENLIIDFTPVVAPSLGFEHNWTARAYRILKKQVSPYDSRFHSYIIKPDFQAIKEFMDEHHPDKYFIDKTYPEVNFEPIAELEYLTLYPNGDLYENKQLIHGFDTRQYPFELILSVFQVQHEEGKRKLKIDDKIENGLTDRLETINKAIVKCRYYLSRDKGFIGFVFK
ncbi:MAG: hypothetical protein ACE5DX_03720 [Candidatus Dojkabacteria bacterium]